MNLGSIISAGNLKKAAGLGVGSVASRFAANKLKNASMLEGKSYAGYVVNGIPILAGLFLSNNKNSMLSSLGNGMIAESVGNVLAGFIDKDGTMGLNGTNTMLQGLPMMQGVDEPQAATYPNNYLGQNAAGEMEF